jgi:hypothetical protein
MGHQREKFFVIHRPEKVLSVSLHNPLPSALDLLPHFTPGISSIALAISEVGVISYRLEDRFHPVVNLPDAQRPKLF